MATKLSSRLCLPWQCYVLLTVLSQLLFPSRIQARSSPAYAAGKVSHLPTSSTVDTRAVSSDQLSRSQSSSSSAATSVSLPSAVDTSDELGGQNAAVQLLKYLKDSVVQTADGVQLMWRNHGRCNEIRAKQKRYRDVLRERYENEGMSNEDIKRKLKSENGGISYDEYAFLVKGKEDRAKLTQLAFLSWGAPRFLPYVIMFYPEMLPSAFSSPKVTRKDKIETMSRQRTHTVIQTLMNIETAGKQIPALAKLNVFGRGKQQRTMEEMQHIAQRAASIFTTPVENASEGAELVLNTLEVDLYNEDEAFDIKSKRLVRVPKTIVKGLAQSLEGSSPLDGFLPLFFARGKVLNHIKKVADSDEFLIKEAVQLEELGKQRLSEACRDRLIVEIGRSEDEMRESLADWLDQVLVKPSERIKQTGEFYNENLARAAMMCYHASQAAVDDRSASYLPRLLFQGQHLFPLSTKEGGSKKNK